MSKLDEFKLFAKGHPELINYLNNNNDMSWQKFYEIYDIYGDDTKVWEPYLKVVSSNNSVGIGDFLKNMDVSKMQEHIKSAQKALGLLEELTNKGAENISNLKGPAFPRPLNKFFGD